MMVAFYDIDLVSRNAVHEIKRVGLNSFVEHGINIRMIRNYEDVTSVLDLFRISLENQERYEDCAFIRDQIQEWKKKPAFPIDTRCWYI